jgi:hypothetical protein
MEAPATKAAAEIATMETTRKWRPGIAKIIAGRKRQSKAFTRFTGC